jgi:hypothetical protein
MRAIYTVILISGLYTDGHVKSSTPVPVSQFDCVAIAQTLLESAKCVRLSWPTDAAMSAAIRAQAQ